MMMCTANVELRVFLLAVMLTLSQGFSVSAPPSSGRLSSSHHSSHSTFCHGPQHSGRARTLLFQLKDGDDDSDLSDQDSDTDVELASSNKDDPRKQIFRVVFDVFESISSAFFFTVSTVTSVGLLLNIFGYGLTTSPEEGLRIDTLETLRSERQFQAEFNRISSSVQSPSALPK